MNKFSSKFCWKRATQEEIKNHIKIVIESNVSWKNGCLEWIGYVDKDGYGRMKYFKKFVHSTRLIWFIEKDEYPEGKVICHTCDNPSCLNIDHLFLGTVKDNTKDAFDKGRRIGRRGKKSNFAKLTIEEVIKIKIMLKEKIPQRTIGEIFGVSRGAICDISRNRNWKHVEI